MAFFAIFKRSVRDYSSQINFDKNLIFKLREIQTMANKDFFLNPDEAQTLGDINYMRKHDKIRHTFPKTLKNPKGFEVVKDISSVEETSMPSFQESSQESTKESSFSSTTSQSSSSTSSSSSKSTPSSSNMDMFRNMARNIGKR